MQNSILFFANDFLIPTVKKRNLKGQKKKNVISSSSFLKTFATLLMITATIYSNQEIHLIRYSFEGNYFKIFFYVFYLFY